MTDKEIMQHVELHRKLGEAEGRFEGMIMRYKSLLSSFDHTLRGSRIARSHRQYLEKQLSEARKFIQAKANN